LLLLVLRGKSAGEILELRYLAITENKAANTAVKAAAVRMYTQKGKGAAAFPLSGDLFWRFAFEGGFAEE